MSASLCPCRSSASQTKTFNCLRSTLTIICWYWGRNQIAPLWARSGVDLGQRPALALRLTLAALDLVFDRLVPLEVARETGIDQGAHVVPTRTVLFKPSHTATLFAENGRGASQNDRGASNKGRSQGDRLN